MRARASRVRRPAGLVLALAVSLTPGCRVLGRSVQGFYEVSAGLFTPNPVAVGPFYGGVALGVVATSPLLLLSWPLGALLGPPLDGGQWGLAVRLGPTLGVAVLVGDLLALPFWLVGLPFESERHEGLPVHAPAPEQGPGLAGQPGDG